MRSEPTDEPRVAPVRRSASNLVADRVRELVFDGALRQGDKVPQQEIAEQLGVSRIPVREALVALERGGVLVIEPHRGAFVNAFDADAIEDHYELFGLVYGHAARRTAERATPEDLEALRRVRIDLRKHRDPDAVLAGSGRFRTLIQRIGGSPRLRALMTSLSGIVPGNFFEVVPASIAVARRDIPAAIRAIEDGDGDLAAERCLAMMRSHGRNVVKRLDERGLFG